MDAFFTKLAIDLHSRHAHLHWQSLPLLLLHTSQRLSQLPQNGSVIDNWTDCGGCTLNSVIRTYACSDPISFAMHPHWAHMGDVNLVGRSWVTSRLKRLSHHTYVRMAQSQSIHGMTYSNKMTPIICLNVDQSTAQLITGYAMQDECT